SRRGAIRETTRRRSGPSELRDYSQVTVLPSLPSSIGHQIPDAHTPTGNTGNFEGRSPVSSTDGGIVDMSLGALEATAVPETQQRRVRIVAGLAAGALLFGVAGFLFRVSSRSAEPEPAEHASVAALAPQPVAPPPPAAVTPPPPISTEAPSASEPSSKPA